jgi:nucleoside-diphosphate-sugar epimerase
MKPSLLIIGGSRFVGRVLVEEMLKANDYQLFVLNRGNRPLNLDGVTELRADRHDTEALRRAIPPGKWAGVIDFCGYNRHEVETLLNALAPESAAHYLFISTVRVYRESLSLPLVETAPLLTGPQPELGQSPDYGFDKCGAETAVMAICRKAGIAWTILRPAIIYGRYNYAPRERYFFELLRKGDTVVIPEKGLALFQFVLVDDLARIIRCCLRDEFSRNTIFNVAAPDLISYARYVSVLEEISGNRVPVQPLPEDEISARQIPLPFPPDSHIIISTERLVRSLGFEYTEFTEGMRRTWQWFNGRR